MRNDVRMRIAVDMCIQEKFKFFASIFILFLASSLVIMNIYIVASANSYRYKVQKGLSVPLEKVIWYSFEPNDYEDADEIFKKITQNSDISNVGSILSNVSNGSRCLMHLREVQSLCKRFNKDSDYMQRNDISTNVISKDLWNAMNYRILEGKAPNEYILTDKDVLLYFSEEYKGIVDIGQEFIDEYAGEVVYKYIVAGFISSESTMFNSSYFNEEQVENCAFHSMEYGIVEVIQGYFNSGYAILRDESCFHSVRDYFYEIADMYEADMQIYSVDAVVKSAEIIAKNSSYYLNEIMIIMIVISLISVISIQIFEMLTRADEYGIILTCKATKKDLIIMIFFQNAIRNFIAIIMSLLVMFVLLLSLYGNSPEMKIITRDLYLLYCVPIDIIVCIVLIVLESIIPAIIIGKADTVNLLKGELSK